MKEWLPFDPRYLAAVSIVFCIFLAIKGREFSPFLPSFRMISAGVLSRQILILAIVAGMIMIFTDAVIMQYVQTRLEDPMIKGIHQFGKAISRNVGFWLVISAGYVVAVFLRKPRLRQITFGVLMSTVLTGLICHLMKFLFLRARPYGELGPHSFFNLRGLTENEHVFQSLPSGDVALVAGAAAYLFWTVRSNWVRLFIILLPVTTAFSRVYAMKHWPSDALTSIGIGLIVACILNKGASCKTPIPA